MNRLFRTTPSPTLLFLLLITAVIMAVPAMSQPRTISFQGILASPNGEPVSDGIHRLTLRLYDAANAASAIYAETHDAPVVRGVFNVIIGTQTPIPTTIAFDRQYYLGVTIGTGSELLPRTPMTSVPYSLRAVVANDVAASAPLVRSVNGRTGDLTFQGA
ncbi:MAG: hypothetical protein H7X80_07290, partial [bacterium]|nr:hypothetical protein [Candidatus Kapabacteria bacterium]